MQYNFTSLIYLFFIITCQWDIFVNRIPAFNMIYKMYVYNVSPHPRFETLILHLCE